jgi:hypothetical protein
MDTKGLSKTATPTAVTTVALTAASWVALPPSPPTMTMMPAMKTPTMNWKTTGAVLEALARCEKKKNANRPRAENSFLNRKPRGLQ